MEDSRESGSRCCPLQRCIDVVDVDEGCGVAFSLIVLTCSDLVKANSISTTGVSFPIDFVDRSHCGRASSLRLNQ